MWALRTTSLILQYGRHHIRSVSTFIILLVTIFYIAMNFSSIYLKYVTLRFINIYDVDMNVPLEIPTSIVYNYYSSIDSFYKSVSYSSSWVKVYFSEDCKCELEMHRVFVILPTVFYDRGADYIFIKHTNNEIELHSIFLFNIGL